LIALSSDGAEFLKDSADKTRRGLRGRIEAGKSGGGSCCGYRVVKSMNAGALTTGEREVDQVEAAVVVRILREFAAGVSPKDIAKRLNPEGVAGPFGSQWSPSTIHGHHARGTGIMNNELEATETLRGLIDEIVLTPADGTLRIELKGNLAAILGAARSAKVLPASDDVSAESALMVAGGRNGRWIPLLFGAA